MTKISMSALSPQQSAVVDFIATERGSLNIVARAGCGKTHTLIRGVVRDIVENERGTCVVMAFNSSAGEEFKQRIDALALETGDPRYRDWKRLQAGTVHSFGFRLVRKWAPGVKVASSREVIKDKLLWICDDFARARLGPRPDFFKLEAQPLCKLVGLAKQAAVGFLTGLEDRKAWYEIVDKHAVNDLTDEADVDELVEGAIALLKESNARAREWVDFDDMVYLPLIKKMRPWPQDFVLVDEAQDTNPSRRCLALAMVKPKTGRLICVGDDRQAIYGFTGADSDALDIIQREVNAAVLPLTMTYRCPKAVVKEANRLVPDLIAHESAPEGEVLRVGALTEAGAWYAHMKLEATDGILCRNTAPLIETAYSLLAAGIGCRVEGREIGTGLIKLATRWKSIKRIQMLEEKLEDYLDREIAKWNAKGREDRAQATEDKVNALTVICRALREQGKEEISDIVDWIEGMFTTTKPGAESNVTTLSTIHKAKGREWKRVFLLYRDTTLPSAYARKEWQIKQEENLEYVAITRAKETLVYVD